MLDDDNLELSANDFVSDKHKKKYIFESYDRDWHIFNAAGLMEQSENRPTDKLSLISLCCEEIIGNPIFLEKLHIPATLFPVLLTEAMRCDFLKSAGILLKNWPLKAISLSEVLPDFRIRPYLHDWGSPRQDKVKDDFGFLVDLFFDIMKNVPKSRLRVLDLRGRVLGKNVMDCLIRQITSLINTQNLTESDRYHIIVDCKISGHVGKLLNDLLNGYHDNRKFQIRLHINKLVLTAKSDSISCEIFKKLDLSELVGLSLKLGIPTLYKAATLEKFTSLVALEILYFTRKNSSLASSDLPEIAGEMLPLHLMPHLRRLALMFRRKNLVFSIPSVTLGKLEYLDIIANDDIYHRKFIERIIGDDLRFLTSVPLHLRELLLDGNIVLTSQLNLWRTLLQSVARTLRVLSMNHCLTNDEHFETIVNFILPMNNLRILYLFHKNPILPAAQLVKHVPKFGSMPRLEHIELADGMDDELVMINDIPEYVPRYVWCKHIDQKLAALKSPPIMVIWIGCL